MCKCYSNLNIQTAMIEEGDVFNADYFKSPFFYGVIIILYRLTVTDCKQHIIIPCLHWDSI